MAEPSTKPTMSDVHPFWGYATVVVSSVDEIERDSGLIVPVGKISDDVKRGVILEVSAYDRYGDGRPIQTELSSGTPIYYRAGITVGDIVLVALSDVVAYLS